MRSACAAFGLQTTGGTCISVQPHRGADEASTPLTLVLPRLSRLRERFRRLYSPEDPVTYKEGLLLSGLLLGSTLPAKAYTIFSQLVWNTSILHFFLKIVMEENVELQVAMEALHWAVMNGLGSFGGLSLILRSGTFRTLHASVKAGVFSYRAPLSPQQEEILVDEKERIHFSVKMFFWLLTIAFFSTQLKGILFDHHEWSLQFPGWFPFEINSLGTYMAGFLFQVVMGYNLVMSAQAMCICYSALSGHLCSQLRILSLAIRDLLREPAAVEDRLRECVQHHNRIIEFHSMMQYYFNILLLVLAVTIIIMFCLVGYVVTDPDSELIVIVPLMTVFIPELVIVTYFCYNGQRIMDASEELSVEIYRTEWAHQGAGVRRDLVCALRQAQRTFLVSGGGIQTFNLQGLAEILQASYSYFNMLVALRKK